MRVRVAKIPGVRLSGARSFVRWCLIFVGSQYELVSCYRSGSQNFQVGPRCLENMWREFGEQIADFASALQRQSRFLIAINPTIY